MTEEQAVSDVSTPTQPSMADMIFAVDDIQREMVTVPEWGGVTIEVRSMTARDRVRLVTSAVDDEGRPNLESVYPDLVILCSYNPETGSRVFQPNQRELVLNRSAAAVEQIATVAMNLSGLGSEAVEAAKKVSTETLSDSSSSN